MARKRDLPGQRALLSAATWSVLAEHGLPGLTVRAVAERAGCSTGLVMHAFPDKRSLLRHARELLHERTADQADDAERGAGEPMEKLRAVVSRATSAEARHRDETRVWIGFLAASLADPALADLHVTHNRAFLGRVQRLLAAAHPDWDDAQRGQAAISLVALVEGLNTLAVLDPVNYSARARASAIEAALDSIIGQASTRG